MNNMLTRIIASKKFVLTVIPIVANLIAMTTGWSDPAEPIMLVVDALFGLLVASQAMLDYKWGSPSDGMATLAAGPALAKKK